MPRFARLSRHSATAATLATLAGCVAGAFNALPAAPAAAAPMSTKTFTYADMPDIDQKRSAGKDPTGIYHFALGSNNGLQYCGPTAAMDALTFLADHGAADMAPGSHDWTASANYDTMTNRLSELGGLMGTGDTTGTSLGGFQNGLLTWSATRSTAAHRFGLVSEFPVGGADSDNDENWQAPNLGIAAFTEAVGNPVIVSIGYYTPVIVSSGDHDIIGLRRTGGHFVAMTGFDSSGLNFMDPADSGPDAVQSAYSNQQQPVVPVTAIYEDSNGNPLRPDLKTETRLRMPGYAGGTAYIEGYTIIQPSYRLTAKRNYILIQRAGTTLKFKTRFPGLAADVQLSPAGDSAYYVMANSKTINKLNLATGVSTTLTRTSTPATSLAVDTQGETVYAAAGRQVTAVSNTGAKIAQTTLPSAAATIAYDPTRGQVDAITPKSKAVQVLAASLQPAGTVSLPASALAKASTISASVDSTTGALTIKAPGVASTVVSSPAPVVNPAASSVAAVTPVSAVDTAAIAANTVAQPATTTSVASLVTAPIVKVTPIGTPVTKIPQIAIALHGAVTKAPATSPAAPATIVRTPHNVLATGVLAEQTAG